MNRPRSLLFLVTEDWFFVSHFLAVACRARDDGFVVSVHVRIQDPALKRRIEAENIRVLPSVHRRGHFAPLAMAGHIMRFARLLRRERPDVVHLISVRLIVLGGLAAVLARVPARVQAVTGLGLLAASGTLKARLARRALGWLLRGPLGGGGVAYVFENREDPVLLGLDPESPQLTIVGGAGIDPIREPQQAWPPLPPLKVAVVARMIASKGVDLAVEAVGRVRREGHAVSLTLVGAPDRHNPRSFTAADLEGWAQQPGISWAGHTADVQAVWRDHHVVCVPSRGGEGLPRSLLEGAAAGRAVLTTQTPGCATFARDEIEGFVVPPGSAVALADALTRLAQDPERTARMGQAARARVLDGFTNNAVSDGFLSVYRALCPASPR